MPDMNNWNFKIYISIIQSVEKKYSSLINSNFAEHSLTHIKEQFSKIINKVSFLYFFLFFFSFI